MFCPYFIVGVDLGVRAATGIGSEGRQRGAAPAPFFCVLAFAKEIPDK